MRGLQKAYVVVGDPKSSVTAMRHAWRAHYDLERLTFDPLRDGAVRFAVEDYRDMPMSHALMTAGWGIAAARAAGAKNARLAVITRRWRGDAAAFAYEISF